MHLRRIPLEHLHNLRDLGGYPAASGRVTKWNRLYRSDLPDSLSSQEWQTLKDLGITLLIDLRSKQEQGKSPVTPGYPVKYEALPLIRVPGQPADPASTDEQTEEQAAAEFLKSMDLSYTDVLFGNLPGAVKILEDICDHLRAGSSVLFFCTAGKDRTGITAALVLYLCGAAREDIIADYMVSHTYNDKGINQMAVDIPKELREILPDEESLKKGLASDPETMAALLDSFESRDIKTALTDNGFGEEKQKELALLMTEPVEFQSGEAS